MPIEKVRSRLARLGCTRDIEWQVEFRVESSIKGEIEEMIEEIFLVSKISIF